ncbi:MAG TPA: ECF-type sigma factor [Bryobacteraceae bacterium]|jgi:RNA polymerase sigma factor (TIGR02999 family)|nr:ECF-type sigma factor [Bryobacteraceae bacterium]
MSSKPGPQITHLLDSAGHGDDAAAAQIIELVYAELRRLAAHYMSGEKVDHTLQTTALVHEAFLELFGQDTPMSFRNTGHFFAVAAIQMRRILVDHARQGNAQKRRVISVPLDEAYHISSGRDDALVALDDALKELAEVDPDASKVIELRFFGGYTDKETAEILDKNVAKVRRDWEFGRAWLYSRLDESGK